MPLYIGTKLINAEPFAKNGEPGYTVVYPDGYTSWSPKAVFEEAYRLVSVTELTMITEQTKPAAKELVDTSLGGEIDADLLKRTDLSEVYGKWVADFIEAHPFAKDHGSLTQIGMPFEAFEAGVKWALSQSTGETSS